MTLDKYKQNLRIEGDIVYSYNTHVATIEEDYLAVHGYWSETTARHINYVAKEFNLQIISNQKL